MTHTHIHVPKPPAKRSRKVDVAVATALIALAALLAFGQLVECHSQSITAPGSILETRIVVDHSQESYYGGFILYRAEALVRFQREGRSEVRWLTASNITSERDLLALKLAAHPQTCLVPWSPGHPENAKCLIPEK